MTTPNEPLDQQQTPCGEMRIRVEVPKTRLSDLFEDLIVTEKEEADALRWLLGVEFVVEVRPGLRIMLYLWKVLAGRKSDEG